jgi:hypothetical protein
LFSWPFKFITLLCLLINSSSCCISRRLFAGFNDDDDDDDDTATTDVGVLKALELTMFQAFTAAGAGGLETPTPTLTAAG